MSVYEHLTYLRVVQCIVDLKKNLLQLFPVPAGTIVIGQETCVTRIFIFL